MTKLNFGRLHRFCPKCNHNVLDIFKEWEGNEDVYCLNCGFEGLSEDLIGYKIMSGGQTGVDRGALDFAIENGFDYSGYIPVGRRAEDGKISEKYENLVETVFNDYIKRTEMNVEYSDGTLIIAKYFNGGSWQTEKICRNKAKPNFTFMIRNMNKVNFNDNKVNFWKWMDKYNIKELNVAGNRESKAPGIYEKTKFILTYFFE